MERTTQTPDEDSLCIRTIVPRTERTLIEAHGVNGWKKTPWSKLFDSQAELDTWVRVFDATVHGQKTIQV